MDQSPQHACRRTSAGLTGPNGSAYGLERCVATSRLTALLVHCAAPPASTACMACLSPQSRLSFCDQSLAHCSRTAAPSAAPGPRLPAQVMCTFTLHTPCFPWSPESCLVQTVAALPNTWPLPDLVCNTLQYIHPAASFIYVADLFQRPPLSTPPSATTCTPRTLLHRPSFASIAPRSENNSQQLHSFFDFLFAVDFRSPLSFPALLATPPTTPPLQVAQPVSGFTSPTRVSAARVPTSLTA